MLTKVKRGLEIFKRRGLVPFIKEVYIHLRGEYLSRLHPEFFYANTIRPKTRITHDRVIKINGVNYHPDRTFDRFLPWDFVPETPSEFEAGTINALTKYVNSGDRVVVVGGGRGITSVVAAQQAGPEGVTYVYEGALHLVDQVCDTAKANSVSERIEVRHGIVGSLTRLDGPRGDAPIIGGDELPDCDVLEMDCEGAETDILPMLEIRPRKIIVESHNNRDQIHSQLDDLGYEIISEQPAETRLPRSQIEDWGLYTIVAENSE